MNLCHLCIIHLRRSGDFGIAQVTADTIDLRDVMPMADRAGIDAIIDLSATVVAVALINIDTEIIA